MNNLLYSSLKVVSIIIFLSLIPLLFLFENATSIVWTMVIPLLPLFIIIIGFSNWRNICPLAFFSKISQRLYWIKKRKVPVWFENNFYNFQYTLLFIAFSLRLITLNYNNSYLGVFFILAIISAFAINIVYTGKSWCNFFCPVGVVEKIYCISDSQNYNSNSACSPCTACKKNCPDIDMENNYWKESVNKQKSFVFYSFPGLILGFYLYFYLQSGSYEYYFNGDWTKTDISIFSNGFFFAPLIPTIFAAPITLAFFSFASFLSFNTLEKYLWKHRKFKNATYETTLHRVKVIASYIAFNTFYAFAGAPTYLNYPDSYGLFYFVVVAISSVYMYREFFREQSFFVQERFALKILKKWDKTKPFPTNLKEIYYTYINETKNQEDRLSTYETTIRDLLQEGILNEDSSMLLTKLREQIGVTENDHLKIMKKLKHEDEDLFDHSIEQSTDCSFICT